MQNVDVNLNFDRLYFDTETTLRVSYIHVEIFFIDYVLSIDKNRTYTDRDFKIFRYSISIFR